MAPPKPLAEINSDIDRITRCVKVKEYFAELDNFRSHPPKHRPICPIWKEKCVQAGYCRAKLEALEQHISQLKQDNKEQRNLLAHVTATSEAQHKEILKLRKEITARPTMTLRKRPRLLPPNYISN